MVNQKEERDLEYMAPQMLVTSLLLQASTSLMAPHYSTSAHLTKTWVDTRLEVSMIEAEPAWGEATSKDLTVAQTMLELIKAT